MRISPAVLAISASLLSAVPASATTFLVNRSAGAGSVSGSITTDNTLGTLTTANITAFNLLLNDGTTTFTLTNANGQVAVVGTGLSATATTLNFNYALNAAALFQSPTIGATFNFFCFQGTNFACGDGTNVAGDLVRIQGGVVKTIQAGTQVVGTAAAGVVPEAASWELMILGFGGLGYVLRRRRAVIGRLRLA